MANEVYVFGTLRVTVGQRKVEFSSKDRTADLASSANYQTGRLTVGTTAVQVDFGDVSSPNLGAFMIATVASGAYIELSLNSDGSAPFAKLQSAAAEEDLGLAYALIPISGAAIYAKADSAGRKLEFLLMAAS